MSTTPIIMPPRAPVTQADVLAMARAEASLESIQYPCGRHFRDIIAEQSRAELRVVREAP